MHRALLLALSLIALPSIAAELEPYSASYTADWKQLPVSGSAERSLNRLEDGRWSLDFEASMLVAGLSEKSTFMLENGIVKPLKYRFERGGLGSSKKVKQDFNWAQKTVTGSDRDKPINLPLNIGLQDKASYQVALQLDVADGKKSMSYQVVDGDEVETYDFRVLGEETVRTRAGLIDAIKVERVRDPTQTSRKTTLWFAKDFGNMLVRLHQVETDGKEYQIMLKDGSVNGQPVKGR